MFARKCSRRTLALLSTRWWYSAIAARNDRIIEKSSTQGTGCAARSTAGSPSDKGSRKPSSEGHDGLADHEPKICTCNASSPASDVGSTSLNQSFGDDAGPLGDYVVEGRGNKDEKWNLRIRHHLRQNVIDRRIKGTVAEWINGIGWVVQHVAVEVDVSTAESDRILADETGQPGVVVARPLVVAVLELERHELIIECHRQSVEQVCRSPQVDYRLGVVMVKVPVRSLWENLVISSRIRHLKERIL